MKPFQIFRPGEHTDMHGRRIAFSDADVRAAAAAYDPAVHEAPIVIGHPVTDAPAYGWIRALSYQDFALVAEPREVEPTFAELVRAGRYKKVSASFYMPGAATNPAPGTWYLRHIGFLGAAAPAVKGLKPIELVGGSDDGCVSIELGELAGWTIAGAFRRLRDFLIGEYGAEKAEQALSGDVIDSLMAQAAMPDLPASAGYSEPHNKETDSMESDLTAREAAVQAAEAQLTAQRESLAAEQRAFAEQRRRDEAAAFVEQLCAAGKVLPRDKAGITALVARLDADQVADAAFAETGAEPVTAGQYLRRYLTDLPVQVEFRELSADDGAPDALPDDPIAAGHVIGARAAAYQERQAKEGEFVTPYDAGRHIERELKR